ncbi:hypothetical protein AWB78_01312 [Caballeronia calidae]|uniref:Uncharacterized protein n=1 Tax=Caballeronia calidae TaxID=1777139 RepID=A0A158A614_9BURK|nr:hypothetical protein [Caballeronia calidae]SAK53294.1 hypothetical protein AWB78_01312 [Caballeronia calidae]
MSMDIHKQNLSESVRLLVENSNPGGHEIQCVIDSLAYFIGVEMNSECEIAARFTIKGVTKKLSE